MKPAPFDYYAPTTVEDATRLLADRGDDAKVLAGGQSLVPMLNLRLTRFEALIDLGRIEALKRIECTSDGLVLGSMVRQYQIEDRADVAAAVPLLAAATPLIGHFQIRNLGTVGGSIAHADPAAEYPAVALALDAELDVAGPAGTRAVAAADFFTGTWTTSLAAEEVLVAVRLRSWGPGSGFAVEEVARRHGDFAIAGAAVGVQVSGSGSIARAAIALFGMASTPVRAHGAESRLVGTAADAIDAEEVGRAAVADLAPPEDLHASRDLRRRIGAVVVARAIRRALEEAKSA